ncbi:MAG: autophagy protein 13 [Bogoriella megaspora]|nr:MAG: autophagy protein 13 [Bogoriella megaspora]
MSRPPSSLSYNERGAGEAVADVVTGDDRFAGQSRDETKLNQVIQQFYSKAALTIISSRVTLKPALTRNGEVRQTKWFNTTLDDAAALVEDLEDWRTADIFEERPPPLMIEIFVDTSDLTSNQTFSIVDENGKRWDALEFLKDTTDVSSRSSSRSHKGTQIVLERWKVELGDASLLPSADMTDSLPNIYKKSVVLFRSLYTYARLLPAWKCQRAMARKPSSHTIIRLKYRIYSGDSKSPWKDTLNLPLYPSNESITGEYVWAPIVTGAGPMNIQVAYRSNCELRVDDAESLLSSQFMGLDDQYFRPSLEAKDRGHARVNTDRGIGSLPAEPDHFEERADRGQAYGSLSTFHQAGIPARSSPISALRAARDNMSPSSPSPTASPPQKLPPNHRIATGSKSSLRSNDSAPAFQRRASVSFQPFKAGSLSSSPHIPPSPGSSVGKATNMGAAMQKRNSLTNTALPQASLRTPALPNETAIASSASSSPKPAPITRYSSSFGHRRSRLSSGGGSKTEDDNNSSGKGSLASSAQPGSGVLNEGEGGSSGSVQTDEENIQDFLKLLEQKKDLKSLSRTDAASRDMSTRKTAAALSKYQRMRDSNTALSDSLSTSMHLHRSSSTSSRQLSSVPPMVAGTSVSTSSSPGKPISPHTPHTPAVPSRLSANYTPHIRESSRHGESGRRRNIEESEDTERERTPHAIDIPTSPRLYSQVRRSSSVAQQHRAAYQDDDIIPFEMRSASLPAEERGDLSLSELLQLQQPMYGPELPPNQLISETETFDQQRRTFDSGVGGRFQSTHQHSTSNDSREGSRRPGSGSSFPMRTRGTTSARARLPSGDTSSTSLRAGSAGSSDRGSRQSIRPATAAAAVQTPADDDGEPLLFAMSDFGAFARTKSEDSGNGKGKSDGKNRRGGSGGWAR